MPQSKITLKEAESFHGHLGPWLVLGLLAGESALKRLKAKKHFGIKVKVFGATKRPRSCLIDGIQLSTGATYGKGNIEKLNSKSIKIEFINLNNHKKVTLRIKDEVIRQLDSLTGYHAGEILAKKLYRWDNCKIFEEVV